MAGVVVQCARVADGTLRVLIHADQTAELVNARGTIIVGRVPLYRIGRELAALGYAAADLLPD